MHEGKTIETLSELVKKTTDLAYTRGERSKGKVMLSGRLSEISPTSHADASREESAQNLKSALTPEVLRLHADEREGSRPLSSEGGAQ